MSSEVRLGFRTDWSTSRRPDLILTVYRESSTERTEALSHWVNASLLATQPVYRHQDPIGYGYHEVVCPFVHRIGVEPGTMLEISENQIIPLSPKKFNYAIVGDATSIPGLAAPYNEEETHETLKIECMEERTEIITSWTENANTDQFTTRIVETAELAGTNN